MATSVVNQEAQDSDTDTTSTMENNEKSLQQIMTLIDDNKNNYSEGDYLSMCNTIKKMYEFRNLLNKLQSTTGSTSSTNSMEDADDGMQGDNTNIVVNDVRTTMIVVDLNTKISMIPFIQKLGLIFACSRIYPIIPTFKLLHYTVFCGSLFAHIGFFLIYVGWYTLTVAYPVHVYMLPYIATAYNCCIWTVRYIIKWTCYVNSYMRRRRLRHVVHR